MNPALLSKSFKKELDEARSKNSLSLKNNRRSMMNTYINSTNNVIPAIPLTDIVAADKEIILKVEMPGIDKAKISLELLGDELTVYAKRIENSNKNGYTTKYSEKTSVGYYRKFKLGAEIDKDSINADYKDGILTIKMYKNEKIHNNMIKIQ